MVLWCFRYILILPVKSAPPPPWLRNSGEPLNQADNVKCQKKEDTVGLSFPPLPQEFSVLGLHATGECHDWSSETLHHTEIRYETGVPSAVAAAISSVGGGPCCNYL